MVASSQPLGAPLNALLQQLASQVQVTATPFTLANFPPVAAPVDPSAFQREPQVREMLPSTSAGSGVGERPQPAYPSDRNNFGRGREPQRSFREKSNSPPYQRSERSRSPPARRRLDGPPQPSYRGGRGGPPPGGLPSRGTGSRHYQSPEKNASINGHAYESFGGRPNASARDMPPLLSSSSALQPSFDIKTFDPTDPKSWEALKRFWMETHGREPSLEEAQTWAAQQLGMLGPNAASAPQVGVLASPSPVASSRSFIAPSQDTGWGPSTRRPTITDSDSRGPSQVDSNFKSGQSTRAGLNAPAASSTVGFAVNSNGGPSFPRHGQSLANEPNQWGPSPSFHPDFQTGQATSMAALAPGGQAWPPSFASAAPGAHSSSDQFLSSSVPPGSIAARESILKPIASDDSRMSQRPNNDSGAKSASDDDVISMEGSSDEEDKPAAETAAPVARRGGMVQDGEGRWAWRPA